MIRGSIFVCTLPLLIFFQITPLIAINKRPISEHSLGTLVSSSDLVIQGEIIDVEVKKMNMHEVWGGPPRGGPKAIITEFVIRIERVLAGEYEGETISVILREGKTESEFAKIGGYEIITPSKGDDVIVGLWHNNYGYNRLIISFRDLFLKFEGNDYIPYEKSIYLNFDNPLGLIEKRGKERKFEELYKHAEVVCIGSLEDNNTSERKLVLRLEEVLKGDVNQPKITIDYSTGYTIDYDEIGFRLLFFLEKKENIFRIFTGVNGIYPIRDGKLIRRNKSPLNTNLSKLKKDIKVWGKIRKY